MKSADRDPSRTKLLGLGLDGTDGHTRLTRGDDFMLCGGAIIEVVDGEAVSMDQGRLERMRRRLTTLRRHQLAEDFR